MDKDELPARVAREAAHLIYQKRIQGKLADTQSCLYEVARSHNLMLRIADGESFSLKPKPEHAKTVNRAWRLVFEMGAWK